MSGLKVVAAVAAVISAFHEGSEVFKIVKDKCCTRKALDEAKQEWEEKQLHDSLVAGVQQISLRWVQDIRELGEYMRIGDVIARERLNQIVVTLQAELIESLALAAIHGMAILNLQILHQVSVLSKAETFATLDELKQRLYITRQIPRSPKALPAKLGSRRSTAPAQDLRTNDYSRSSLRTGSTNGYLQMAVNLASHERAQDSRYARTDFLQLRRSNSTPITQSEANFSAAFQEPGSTRVSEDNVSIMQSLEDMISSYKGLHVGSKSNVHSRPNQNAESDLGRHDSLTILNDGSSHLYDPAALDQDGMPLFDDHSTVPPSENAVSHQILYDAQRDQKFRSSQYMPHHRYSRSHSYMQTPTLSPLQWSDASATSSPHSDAASLERNNSNSSNGSNYRVRCSPQYPRYVDASRLSTQSTPPRAIDRYLTEYHNNAPSSVVSDTEDGPFVPVAPLSPQRRDSRVAVPSTSPPRREQTLGSPTPSFHTLPRHIPWPGSESDSPTLPQYASCRLRAAPIEEHVYVSHPFQSSHRLLAPSIRSSASDRTLMPAGFAAVAAAASKLTGARDMTALRYSSFTPSIASTDSGGSGSIGILPGSRMRLKPNILSNIIESGRIGREKVMDSRPDKQNNYWGFCKGAWAVRDDIAKGIAVRIQPLGMYNSRQVWECRECTFKGEVFTRPHPTKKNKTVEVVDPRVHASVAGVRYRWIFLAKSHVKRKVDPAAAAAACGNDECKYGCVFCSVEGSVTSIFGGVESLMNHIRLVHVADMSDRTRKMTNCVLGRVAGAEEEFDINVPIFAQVGEMAG